MTFAQRALQRYQYSYSYTQPMAIHVDLSPQINARVQEAAARIAAGNAAMYAAAAQMKFADRKIHVSVPRLRARITSRCRRIRPLCRTTTRIQTSRKESRSENEKAGQAARL